MVQTKGDQRTFDNTEDQRSQITRSCDQSAQGIDPVLYHWPDKIHQDAHAHIGQRRDDRHKP